MASTLELSLPLISAGAGIAASCVTQIFMFRRKSAQDERLFKLRRQHELDVASLSATKVAIHEFMDSLAEKRPVAMRLDQLMSALEENGRRLAALNKKTRVVALRLIDPLLRFEDLPGVPKLHAIKASLSSAREMHHSPENQSLATEEFREEASDGLSMLRQIAAVYADTLAYLSSDEGAAKAEFYASKVPVVTEALSGALNEMNDLTAQISPLAESTARLSAETHAVRREIDSWEADREHWRRELRSFASDEVFEAGQRLLRSIDAENQEYEQARINFLNAIRDQYR